MAERTSLDLAATAQKISKFFGFPPFSVRNGKSYTSRFDLFLFIWNFLTGMIAAVSTITRRKELLTETPEIIEYGTFVSFVIGITIAVIAMNLGFRSRHRIWKLNVDLYNVELKVCFLVSIDCNL